jgi:hypothetical protein
MSMSTDIEKRVATLEKELKDLKKIVCADRQGKDWRTIFGMSANDPGFDEMIRLGSEARSKDQVSEDEG